MDLSLENLPDDEFRRILEELSFKDVGNMRRGSKRLESRVSYLINRYLCNTFHVETINPGNCDDISRSLALAMAKDHAPDKLELKFYGELNTVMNQILIIYKDNISSLEIQVKGNEELLLELRFESLESLTLDCYGSNPDNMVSVCEAMLDKHAQYLKIFKVYHLKKNLIVPALPVLDELSLNHVCKEAAWTLYKQSKNTITSLDLVFTNIEPPSLISVDSTRSAIYKITNIKNLKVSSCNGFKFVTSNAEHLSSLELFDVKDIPLDIEWPQFPHLRELVMYDEKLPHIIPKCKDTLECLVLFYFTSDLDAYAALEIPRLTDLHLYHCNPESLEKILRSNNKSLEYLHLGNVYVSNLDDDIRMEKMKKIVMRSNKHSEEDRDRWSRIYPNAEVVLRNEKNRKEIRGQMKSRQKRKGFFMDMSVFY